MNILKLTDYLSDHEICHVARTSISSPARNLHSHDYNELFWIESGSGTHIINGEETPLVTGDMVFIRPSDNHDFVGNPKQPLVLVNVAFFTGLVEQVFERYPSLRGESWNSPTDQPEIIHVTTEGLFALGQLSRIVDKNRESLFEVDLFIMRILSLVRTEKEKPESTIPRWLIQACKEISRIENFTRGVTAFVEICGRSHEHVARVCRESLGMSPSDLVNNARLAHAAEILSATDRKIDDIAWDCGFESVAYFHKVFKNRYAATPRAYRMHNRALIHSTVATRSMQSKSDS